VSLLAVTKNVGLEDIRRALAAGIQLIGENRIQEARQKFAHIGPAITWHMIGHLQTNKARQAAAIFDMVQSVDSTRVAEALSKAAEGLDRQLDVLIEVNIATEEQKSGVSPGAAEGLVRQVDQLSHLRLRGLMSMAPYVPDPETVRPFFRHMHELFVNLRDGVRRPSLWNMLSMGMTHDYEVAVEEGATLVRIGTGIFARTTAGGTA